MADDSDNSDSAGTPSSILAVLNSINFTPDTHPSSVISGFVHAERSAREYYDDAGKPTETPAQMGYTPKIEAYTAPTTTPTKHASNKVEEVMSALGSIESGGMQVGRVDYNAIGPMTKHGTRAIGAWQVMEENIPAWGREAGFKNVTVAQFRESPQLQHDIVAFQMQKWLDKGYSEKDVASIWFTGHPFRANDKAADVNISASTYVGRFERALAQIDADPSKATYLASNASSRHSGHDDHGTTLKGLTSTLATAVTNVQSWLGLVPPDSGRTHVAALKTETHPTGHDPKPHAPSTTVAAAEKHNPSVV